MDINENNRENVILQLMQAQSPPKKRRIEAEEAIKPPSGCYLIIFLSHGSL